MYVLITVFIKRFFNIKNIDLLNIFLNNLFMIKLRIKLLLLYFISQYNINEAMY